MQRLLAWIDFHVGQWMIRYYVWRFIHWRKYEWIFTGIATGANNFKRDAGFIRSPYPMRRAQALAYMRTITPHATIIHIDDRNKIVTYETPV